MERYRHPARNCIPNLQTLISLLILLLFTLAESTFAGEATVTGATEDGHSVPMQMEYRGRDHVRINFPGQQDSYMLFRSGQAYSVSMQNGQAYVMNLSDLAGGDSDAGGFGNSEIRSVSELVDTGRSETVAGLQGDVWNVTYTDRDGRTHREELVLSDDARAVELARAVRGMSLANGSDDPLFDRIGERGVLRMGNQMRVTAISGENPPLSRFELPAEPIAAPDVGGIGERLGNLFGDQAERQQERAESRTQSEIDQATEEADSAIDRAFDKLFGD